MRNLLTSIWDLIKAVWSLIWTGIALIASIGSTLFAIICTLFAIFTWSEDGWNNLWGLLIIWFVTFLIVGLSGLLFGKPSTKANKSGKPMTGLEFEHYCAELLTKKGFKRVTVTPPSGDYCADLIAYDRKGNKWVFQCKHYKSNVSSSAVQEITAAKAHYRANKAAVMTNSKLTKQARQLAIENEVELFEMLDD